MSDKTDVLIIGGGVIGVCTAYYLTKQGREVTLLEMGEVGSGSSQHNAGLIVPANSIPLAHPGVLGQGIKWMLKSDSPFYIKPRLNLALLNWLWKFFRASNEKRMIHGLDKLNELGRASLELFDQLISEENLDCDFHTSGWLMAYQTRSGLEEAIKEAELLRKYNIDSQELGSRELQAKEPALNSNLAGGVLFPNEGHLNPSNFVQSLAQRIKGLGVDIITDTKVVGAETAHGKLSSIRTATHQYHSKQVVLAAGAWSAELGKLLGLNIPVQAAKGYSVTLPKKANDPKLALYLSEAKVAVTPLKVGLRLAGTLELSGMDTAINQKRVNGILASASKYLELDNRTENLEPWSGLRPCTPDGLPIIGKAPNLRNLFLATGHCMMGMTLAPITGMLLAQLMSGQEPDINLEPFRMGRF